MAALAAYEDIVDQASTSAILTGDDVAAAALETGVGHNLEVLQALMSRVPEQARPAISAAVDRAIARSTGAVERIHSSRSAGSPPVHDGAGAPAVDPTPTPKPTKSPAAEPTATPTSDATATPRPTRKPTPEPTATPEPATPEPAVTTEPTAPPAHTPKPHSSKSPPGQGEHGVQGGQGGG